MSELINDNQLKLDLNETAQAQIDIREDRESFQDQLDEKLKDDRDKLLEKPQIEPAPAPGMSTRRDIQGEYNQLQDTHRLNREEIDRSFDTWRSDIRANGTTPSGEFESAANVSGQAGSEIETSSNGPTEQDEYGPQTGANEPQDSNPDMSQGIAQSKTRGGR